MTQSHGYPFFIDWLIWFDFLLACICICIVGQITKSDFSLHAGISKKKHMMAKYTTRLLFESCNLFKFERITNEKMACYIPELDSEPHSFYFLHFFSHSRQRNLFGISFSQMWLLLLLLLHTGIYLMWTQQHLSICFLHLSTSVHSSTVTT